MTHESLLYYIILLQFLDIATTAYLLRIPGHVEANPIVRKLMNKIGFWKGLIGPKVALVAALLALPLFEWVLYVVSALYTVVVGNNGRLVYLAYQGKQND